MKKYFQAPWSFKDIIAVFITAGLLIGITFFSLRLFDFEKYFSGTDFQGLYILGIFLLQWIAIVLPLVLLTKIKHKKLKAKDFGLKKIGAIKTAKLVVSGYLIFLLISFIISLIIIYTNIKIPGYQVQERMLPMFGEDLFSLITAGVIIIGIAPFLEELFFRGFVLRTLVNKIGVFGGSVISAGIFAAIHMQWASIIPIFILGLIINSIAIKGKSIIPAIFFHAFNNAIAFTMEVLILKDIISFEELI